MAKLEVLKMIEQEKSSSTLDGDAVQAAQPVEDVINTVKEKDSSSLDKDAVHTACAKPVQHATVLDLKFRPLKLLGGEASAVMLVRKEGGSDDGRLYAMKEILKMPKAGIKRTPTQILAAVRTLPFLMQIHYSFETGNTHYLVLEYLPGGDLSYTPRQFTEDEVRIIIGEVILAVEQLHNRGIIHQSIKLENVMFDADGHIVLGNFGKPIDNLQDVDVTKMAITKHLIRRLVYTAPEVLKGEDHGMAVDWYGLGVVTHILLTKKLPFTLPLMMETPEDYWEEVLKVVENKPDIHSTVTCPDAEHFINALLEKDPACRLGGCGRDAKELKEHPFFEGFDWELLATKGYQPPFKPVSLNALQAVYSDLEVAETIPEDCQHIRSAISFGKGKLSPTTTIAEPINVKQKAITLQDMRDVVIGRWFQQKYQFTHRDFCIGPRGVYRECLDLYTGVSYIVKVISAEHAESTDEIQALISSQGHKNVIKLIDILREPYHTYIVLERFSTESLLTTMQIQDSFTEEDTYDIFSQLVSCVKHMHGKGVAHRDLTPQNIYFDNVGKTIKVVDFDCAVVKAVLEPMGASTQIVSSDSEILYTRSDSGLGITSDLTSSESSLVDPTALMDDVSTSSNSTEHSEAAAEDISCSAAMETPLERPASPDSAYSTIPSAMRITTVPVNISEYSAPEVLDLMAQRLTGDGTGNVMGYTESCDLWSLGVILHKMLCTVLPLPTLDFCSVVKRVRSYLIQYDLRHVSDSAECILRCLLMPASDRSTIEELDAQMERWFNGFEKEDEEDELTSDSDSEDSTTTECTFEGPFRREDGNQEDRQEESS